MTVSQVASAQGRRRDGKPWADVDKGPVVGAGIVVVVTLMAVLGPWWAPHRPEALAGAPLQAPSREFLLGTNRAGNDLWSHLLVGARASLGVALAVAAAATIMAVLVGVTAGWQGGTVDSVLRRLIDVVLVTPRLPLLIVLGAYAGRSATAVIVVIAAVSWPGPARTLRMRCLGLRQRGDLRAARGFGAGPLHLVRCHLIPELGPLLVAAFVGIAARAVVLEAGLAFLGIGDPTRISWGATMRDAVEFRSLFRTDAWRWWLLPPIVAVSSLMIGLALVGTALDARANPRLTVTRR